MGKKLSVLDWVFVGILLVVFGGIVLHAPLSVGLSTLFPQADLVIKSWKEILLGIALIISVVLLTIYKRWDILRDKLIVYIALFAALHLLTIFLASTGLQATIAGLLIDLRFLLFFVLVYVALRLYPQLYRSFVMVFFAGAAIVLVFAILQVTVLPHDILKYLGYGNATIQPYLTVDQNQAYVRINSTLRGPNPLGIYAVIVLAAVVAAWVRGPRKFTQREAVLAGILAGGSVIAIWASYSRSAGLAAIVALAVVALVSYGRRVPRKVWIALGAATLIIGGAIVVFRDTQFVSQVLLHQDPLDSNNVNSNDGHAASLTTATKLMLMQPLGAGIGSTGSASLLTSHPIIIENQYLFVAHEVGWLGLALYLMITYIVLKRLWLRRRQWLALGVFASGVGIAVAALLLPVWVDDTVSIIWWGLAAVALAIPAIKTKKVKKA